MPGAVHRVNLTEFRIHGRGEVLTLTDNTGIPVDTFATGSLRSGVTAGRTEPFSSERVLISGGNQFSGYALPIFADIDDLIVDAGTIVSLQTDDPEGVIRYTLNGAEPTERSEIYTAPFTINSNTIIRARVYAPDKLPGTILTRTYLVGVQHDLPIVTLASDPIGLHSHHAGIFANGPGWQPEFPHRGANFHRRWERPTHFAFYEDGELRVEADAGIRVHGSFSRALPQKSIAVFFRSQYGLTRMAYPLVPHVDRTLYDALVLRSGGQDQSFAKLRDTFIANSILGVTNVVAAGGSPVVVYINGQYWGFYNLREKINEDWLEINYGIPDNEVDMVKYVYHVIAGSASRYRQMTETLGRMNMNTDEAYDYVDANIDIDNWIDYWIVITFFSNSDTGNMLRFRQHGDDGKWRWVVYDQDWAMGSASLNRLSFTMLHPQGHGVERFFSTTIARALMRNDRIRERFIERYAELLNTALSADRLIPLLDAHVAMIESEIPGQVSRWRTPASVSYWENEVEKVRAFLRARGPHAQRHLQTTFNLSNERMNELFP